MHRRPQIRCRNRPLRLETLESRALLAFDPTGFEQELMLYVNRMRVDPQAEYDRLIETTTPLKARDPDVNFALQFFRVSGTTLRSQWNTLTPVPPLAWHESLYNAAHFHNNVMIAQDAQEHQLPGEPNPGVRMNNAGYNWNAYSENIFAYAESPLYAHAGFAIDWGGSASTGGIQSPPGHRQNIMSATYREAGMAITPESNPNTDVGPLVVTQDFASRFGFGNPFVVGAVWDDDNSSGWYEAGEGKGGVTIEFTKPGSAAVRVTSMTAGGYQAQLAAGTWNARAFGGPLTSEITSTVVVGSANVMLNFVVPDGLPPVAEPDRAATLRNAPVTIDVRANDSDPDGNLAAATIQIMASPAGSNVAINQAAGTITFTPATNFTGGAVVQYRLRDTQGFFSAPTTVTVAVAHENFARTNPILSRDVDNDGAVSPIDALLLINELNAVGIREFGPGSPGQELVPFYDVSGDNTLSPLDAVEVINYLNATGGGQPEPVEAIEALEAPALAAVDGTLLEMAAWWWLENDKDRAARAAG